MIVFKHALSTFISDKDDMRKVVVLFFSFALALSWSQNKEEKASVQEAFTATVINAQTNIPMESVHVIILPLKHPYTLFNLNLLKSKRRIFMA